MRHEVQVYADADELAQNAAEHIARAARAAIERDGVFRIAFSGGSTPARMLERLKKVSFTWDRVHVYQVDERVAPDGDPARNLTLLQEHLGDLPITLHAIPVADREPEQAARKYAELLPERFDLIHLGLGDDGHTASLVPDQPGLLEETRLMCATDAYMEHRRVTMTLPAIARADEVLWLVSGSSKRDALGQLLAGDPGIPASHVRAARSVVMLDRDADPDR